jgi:hypothetical protein
MKRRRSAPLFLTRGQLIIARLLAICERFGTPERPDQPGHLDNREGLNHLGVCCLRRHWVGGERVPDGTGFRIENQTLDGVCAPSCVEWREATAEARACLAESEPVHLGAVS